MNKIKASGGYARPTVAAAILAAGLAVTASAQAAYDLRVLSVLAGPAGVALGDAQERYADFFTNGNPLVGPDYKNGSSGPGNYLVFGTPSPGAELSGPATDWFGQTFGIGRMTFQQADAAPSPTNLDAPGMVNMRESLILRAPATPVLTPSQQWEVETYWNYTLPDANSTYGIRLSDNTQTLNTPGLPYNDFIDLRLVRSTVNGAPVVSLRRLEWDGSTLAVTQSFNFLLSNALHPGWTLDDVAAIGLRLHYNPGSGSAPGGVIAGVDLVGSHNEEVGYANYAPVLEIFRGESTTTVLANANWAVPVPEPEIWVLGLLGGAGLLLRRRWG